MIYLGYSCKYLAFTQYFSSSHKALDIPRAVTVDGKYIGVANEYSYMAYEGKIVKNAYASDYGYYVEYEVKDGSDTYLIASGHFDTKSPLSVGKTYKRGTIINKIGKTGSNSTGYHDHFRVTKNGIRVNPLLHCYAYSDWNIKGSKETSAIKWYIPMPNIEGIGRNTEVNQIKVIATSLRIRKSPSLSAEQIGWAVTSDIYNDLEVVESDGYFWHKINENMWVATNGKYLELLAKEEPLVIEEITSVPKAQGHLIKLFINLINFIKKYLKIIFNKTKPK